MSECYKDAEALVNLTDNVLYLIETSRDKNLKPAQDIIKKIRSRQFVSIFFLPFIFIPRLILNFI